MEANIYIWLLLANVLIREFILLKKNSLHFIAIFICARFFFNKPIWQYFFLSLLPSSSCIFLKLNAPPPPPKCSGAIKILCKVINDSVSNSSRNIGGNLPSYRHFGNIVNFKYKPIFLQCSYNLKIDSIRKMIGTQFYRRHSQNTSK